MSETRAPTTALAAALSGPAFEGAASRSALHASARHVERWAPEGPSASRSRGLRSLAFADHVASPWMSAATKMNPRTAQMFGGGHGERNAPGVSWVFPRPWFQDELDWMAAARQAAEAQPQFLTTRGTYASARTSPADVVMPVVAPELVVPSMMAGSMSSAARPAAPAGPMSLSTAMVTGMAPAAAPVQHGLRAWSPSVPFAAAAAAEVVAGAVSAASTSGLAAVAERSPLLAGLTVVSPAALSGFAAPRAGQAAAVEASTAAIARIDAARRPEPIAPELMATLARPATSASAPAVEPASGESASASAPSAAPSDLGAPAPSAAPAASPAELAISSAIGASPAMAGALRAIELLIQAASPAAPSAASTATTAAPVAAPSPSFAAPAPSFASPSFAAPSPAFASSSFAPVVGPRVAMPAGLGGLASSLATASTIAQPLARSVAAPASPPLGRAAAAGLSMAAAASPAGELSTPAAAAAELARGERAGEPLSPGFRGSITSWAPVWAQPRTALAAVSSERARAVDHLAWSDRWLARFAGASSVALTALDVARGEAAPAARLLAPNAPEVVYLHPELGPSRLRAAVDATRSVQPVSDRPAAAAAPVARPSGALRIDDGESVPDSVFAALFAPSATTTPAQPPARRRAEQAPAAAPVERPPVSMVDAVRGGSRPTAADLVAISAPSAPDAGLSPGLASSPMAAAMASVIPLPQAPVFDPRALYTGGMATAYLGGLTARAAAPVGVLASAPTAGALASVARFGDLAAAGGAMGGWALRDLALAPLALRLAEAAPERTMLATGGDVDVVVRGGAVDRALGRGRELTAAGVEAPAWTSPARPGLAPTLATPADLERVMLTPAARAAATPAVTPAATTPSAAAPAAAGVTAVEPPAAPRVAPPAEAEAAATPALPAIEPELLALRSALLAAPMSAAAPLAHSFAPILLSTPMAVPNAGAPAELAAPAPSAEVPAPAARGRAAMPAMPMLTLPSVGGAMPSPVAAAMAGHVAGGAFVPPALLASASMGTAGAAAELQASPAELASGRPGALAEQALRWSVAEERTAAGLSFEFVTPEMVLAAKVYGLSPAAAVEASRLAVAGPSALASLATSLDLTFLRSFQQASSSPAARAAIEAAGGAVAPGAPGTMPSAPSAEAAPFAARPGEPPIGAPSTAFAPSTAGAPAPATAQQAAALAGLSPATATSAAAPMVAAGAAPSMFGWDASGAAAAPSTWMAPAGAAPARMPRGAFLWPPGAVSALGLRAQGVDGVAGLPVVALELLAAQAVADLGTWVTAITGTSLAGADQTAVANALRAAGMLPPGAAPSFAGAAMAAAGLAPSFATGGAVPSELPMVAGTAPSSGEAGTAGTMQAGAAGAFATDAAIAAEASAAGAHVDDAGWSELSPAGTTAPVAALRARFEAVYVALSRSAEGMSLSPSARAARAMAVVAGRDGSGLSPRARAAAVWSVMPQVYQGDLDLLAPPARGEGADARSADEWTEARPGLAALASRAGEALGSFVAPRGAELVTAGGRQAEALAQRAAEPVYVQTAPAAQSASADLQPQRQMARPGRTFSQVGGGEPEIPAWFEGAARKMLEERSGGSAGMSLAELVLVTAVPQKQIAASAKSAASHSGHAKHGHEHGKGEDKKPDVNKLAQDVYAEVLKLIDSARERSGDPYQ